MKIDCELTQDLVDRFVAALPANDGIDWYDSYRGFGRDVLRWFLIWIEGGQPETLSSENLR